VTLQKVAPTNLGIPLRTRRAISIIFGSLADPHRKNPEWLDRRFESLLEYVEVPAEQRDVLRLIARQTPDPLRVEVPDPKVGALILSILMGHALSEGLYDPRERTALRYIGNRLGVDWKQVICMEGRLAGDLRKFPMSQKSAVNKNDPSRNLKIVLVALAVGAATLATSGVAAPAIGGAIGTYFMGLSGAAATNAGLALLGGGALAEGGFGMAGGTYLIMAVSGAGGVGVGGRKMARRTDSLKEFAFERLGGTGIPAFIGVSGFLSQRTELVRDWSAMLGANPHADHFALRWESEHLMRLSSALASLTGHAAWRTAVKAFAKRATRAGAALLEWPHIILQLASLIDNPWHVARNRAEDAGALLGKLLADRVQGRRPVTLVGFSLGARVIVHALEELADRGDAGVVENVLLLGGAVSIDHERAGKLATVVSGRMINGFGTADYVLRFLYRATELLERPVGLGPVEGFENVDLTDLVNGHLSYRSALREIFEHIGLAGI